MAKTEVIKFGSQEAKAFFHKSDVMIERKKLDVQKALKKALPVALAVIAGATFALHGGDFTAFASSDMDAIPTMAAGAVDFSEQLRKATKPIRDIIMSFGHEIYGVMMLWGGIEALIGKFQQGVQRMKASTIAYILLVWVPWIVDTVTATAVH